MVTLQDRFRGTVIGTAVGDSLGLPAEGLSRRRMKRIFGPTWRHRFVFGWGMTSDDTEHTVFVGQSLLVHPDSVTEFSRRLAWCLRWWLVSLPAGIGLATLRSILRLWLGFNPARSGVHSAGNGPAMRSAVIGAVFASRTDLLEAYVEASTKLTHSDPRAVIGARTVARLAGWIVREELTQKPSRNRFLALLRQCGSEDREWLGIVETIQSACIQDLSVEGFADSLGLSGGVSGYIYHTVPVAAYAWYKHFGDFEATVTAVLDCGGDTDTVGAISAALAGAVTGGQAIPRDWKEKLADWPRGEKFLSKLADGLTEIHASHKPDGLRQVLLAWCAAAQPCFYAHRVATRASQVGASVLATDARNKTAALRSFLGTQSIRGGWVHGCNLQGARAGRVWRVRRSD